MGDMGILVTVLWRVVGRLLRRLGRGILLVPVAAMAPVLFGLRPWTVAAVLLAVVVAFWRPVMAAVVLPVTMVVAGISGLVVAATAPGPTVNWVVSALGALKRPSRPVVHRPQSPLPQDHEASRHPGAQHHPGHDQAVGRSPDGQRSGARAVLRTPGRLRAGGSGSGGAALRKGPNPGPDEGRPGRGR